MHCAKLMVTVRICGRWVWPTTAPPIFFCFLFLLQLIGSPNILSKIGMQCMISPNSTRTYTFGSRQDGISRLFYFNVPHWIHFPLSGYYHSLSVINPLMRFLLCRPLSHRVSSTYGHDLHTYRFGVQTPSLAQLAVPILWPSHPSPSQMPCSSRFLFIDSAYHPTHTHAYTTHILHACLRRYVLRGRAVCGFCASRPMAKSSHHNWYKIIFMKAFGVWGCNPLEMMTNEMISQSFFCMSPIGYGVIRSQLFVNSSPFNA